MRTKYEIMEAKIAFLEAEAAKARRELEGLIDTPCDLQCEGCGLVFETEGQFAAHFDIPDERYLNLGGCPVVDDPKRPLLTVGWRVVTEVQL